MDGISVVIPCYNYAHYLGAAIDSVLAQTWEKCDIIVVDDGSTDSTRDVVACYGERVHYVHQSNAGLPAARNTGIRRSTTPFVAFLDADDLWAPEHIARAVEAFSSSPLTCGLVAAKGQEIDREEMPLLKVRRDQAFHGVLTVRDIIFRTCFSPSSVVARRDVFDVCGLFDETLTSSEDRDMWIRIAARYSICLLPDASVKIRNHSESMSKNADRMKCNTRRVIGKAFRERLVPRWHGLFWLQVLGMNLFQCAWMYRDQGDGIKGVAQMSLSILVWPWFSRPERLNEPALFRIRALRRFLWESLHGRR
ncbi:MAG: glycosyltransferase family 2 protein [Lentisphaerae bacterium]|nr:glycosyltransferase family 2 protein [Lentisphaerota bacterium]MBT5607031.1 glycosyltransferase family 2 protein [Lentisphaerota bacterium]MBT7055785.1 glycosyltransferase family 2 protein [Lentisphaerota bacterium]